jgi:hypothetical protein
MSFFRGRPALIFGFRKNEVSPETAGGLKVGSKDSTGGRFLENRSELMRFSRVRSAPDPECRRQPVRFP